MPLILMTFLALLPHASADFGNPNSVMIGDRAAGMSGAFTALSSDPSACAFYNPATLAGSQGATLSASASVYTKFDTSYSSRGTLSDSVYRVNRGSFQSIPAAAGSAINFGTFAIGLSVLVPDYDIYNGDINVSQFPNATTFMNYKDQSLWVGGNLAVNFTDSFAAGLTIYYTSRDYFRSLTDISQNAGQTTIVLEEKTYTTNSIVYILGSWWRLGERWKLGLSWRFPSLQLSGDGTYFRSSLDTATATTPTTVSNRNVPAESRVPRKTSLGIAYEIPKLFTLSMNVDNYGTEYYTDMPSTSAGRENIQFNQLTNVSLGGEYYFKEWLALRAGVFTNYSSHPEVQDTGVRQPDHVDMLGFSTNVAIYTDKVSFTFGGYYTGGRGSSTEQVNNRIVRLDKTKYLFNMLIASAYFF